MLHRLRSLGVDVPTLPVPAPERAWRDGEGWLSVGESLERLDPFGWPQAFIARRDGFLIVTVGALGMTRAQVTSLTGRDARWPLADEEGEWPSIAGESIPYDPDPDRCPSCHVRHWLDVLDGWQEGGRFGAKRVCDQPRPERHACQFAPGPGWRAVPALAPSIDRHGWPGEPLSRRSVTALLGRRQEAPFAFPALHDDPDAEVGPGGGCGGPSRSRRATRGDVAMGWEAACAGCGDRLGVGSVGCDVGGVGEGRGWGAG